MNVENLKKVGKFSWHTEEIDGHNIEDSINIFDKIEDIKKPKAIIANTIKGKGFFFRK